MLPGAPPPVRIIESWACTEQGDRVKRYPRRKAKSVSHWHRMDKKWLKRYGYQRVPCIYEINVPTWFYDGAPTMTTFMVHPTLAAKLRHALQVP
jgi:hypothetical protein